MGKANDFFVWLLNLEDDEENLTISEIEGF